MNFYLETLGGEKSDIMRYGDTQTMASAEYKDKILHARLVHKSFSLFFSDAFEGQKLVKGSNVSLALQFDTEEAVDKAFLLLSAGGVVFMDLQKTFWNAKYGKVSDKFGVIWELNYQF